MTNKLNITANLIYGLMDNSWLKKIYYEHFADLMLYYLIWNFSPKTITLQGLYSPKKIFDCNNVTASQNEISRTYIK